MENRVIEVKFKCQQDAEDLFYSPETHKVYARQRSNATGVVFWCTTSKWSRGYEASCRIREGITMRVLDYKDRVCFEETLVHDDWNGGTSAEKKGPFSDEILKAISEEVAKEYNLKRYEDWSKWLDSFRLQLKYRDYRENWLHCESELVRFHVMKAYELLDGPVYLYREQRYHKICKKKFTVYEIRHKGDDICLALCGYEFEE